MATFDQKGQQVNNQINIAGDVNIEKINIKKKTRECSECGKIRYHDEVYRCRRCKLFFCNSHQVNTKVAFCPNCALLTRIEKLLSNPDEGIRLDAAQKICTLKDRSTLPVLKRRLKIESYPIIRHWLYCALGRIGGEEAYKLLKNAESEENDAFVLQGILDGLQSITTETHFDK